MQAAADDHAGRVQRVAGRAGQLGPGQIEVAGYPATGQAQLAVAAQPAGVERAADDDPVGDQGTPVRAVQQAAGQPQRAADLRVRQVDRTVGDEAVIEQQVGGDPQVPRLQAGQPATGQRQPGELGHAQVGHLGEGAVEQLDRAPDVTPDEIHRAGDRGGADAQRPGPVPGQHRDEVGCGQLGPAQVQLAPPGRRLGQLSGGWIAHHAAGPPKIDLSPGRVFTTAAARPPPRRSGRGAGEHQAAASSFSTCSGVSRTCAARRFSSR